ncbi:MAG: RHS repeat-associated core domain-containing protein, partial [Kiritimatiellae bacterium]|nr:RHS repeat-associated core domain-containing protein [Kiritimatiellia bacterium]
QGAAGNSWRYEYGFDSQLLSEEYITTGGTRSCASASTNSISRSYDSFDRPTGYVLTVNDKPKGCIGYAYDDDGDLTHITATNSAGRSFAVAYTNNTGYNYGYTLTTPSGNTIRRIVARDDYRRNLVTNCATFFNSSLVDSNTYTFDALSRPTARTTGTTGVSPVDSTFAYNNRSEVVSAVIGTNLFTHAYDDIGNHLLFGDNAVTYTFTHNQVNQMVGRAAPSAPLISFAYTPDGGLASDGTWSYAYDAEDQLLSVTSSSLTNGAIRALNTYDYRRRRTSKTVQRLNSTIPPPPAPPTGTQEWQTIETRTFVYDDWNLIHETIYAIEGSITNITEIQYFWGLDLSGTLQGAGGVGGLLAVSRNGQLYFPTFDNNGNVTKYIDESGNIVAAYEYDDFGRTISQSGPLADFFRHRFSTKYYDPETGAYYYINRFYSPDWHVWLNRDPLAENGGEHLMGFCHNNAIGYIDYLGLTKVSIKVGVDGSVGWQNFLKIEVKVLEPPENGGKLNFIQLKRRDGEDWNLDIQNTPGPYYLTMIDIANYTKRDKDGKQVISLYDAPGGALTEDVFFYTAVVEVNRKCKIKGKYSFQCYDKVKVVDSVSWSFVPSELKHFRYSGKSDSLLMRRQMIPTLQQLINFTTWKTELCPSTRIEVVP